MEFYRLFADKNSELRKHGRLGLPILERKPETHSQAARAHLARSISPSYLKTRSPRDLLHGRGDRNESAKAPARGSHILQPPSRRTVSQAPTRRGTQLKDANPLRAVLAMSVAQMKCATTMDPANYERLQDKNVMKMADDEESRGEFLVEENKRLKAAISQEKEMYRDEIDALTKKLAQHREQNAKLQQHIREIPMLEAEAIREKDLLLEEVNVRQDEIRECNAKLEHISAQSKMDREKIRYLEEFEQGNLRQEISHLKANVRGKEVKTQELQKDLSTILDSIPQADELLGKLKGDLSILQQKYTLIQEERRARQIRDHKLKSIRGVAAKLAMDVSFLDNPQTDTSVAMLEEAYFEIAELRNINLQIEKEQEALSQNTALTQMQDGLIEWHLKLKKLLELEESAPYELEKQKLDQKNVVTASKLPAELASSAKNSAKKQKKEADQYAKPKKDAEQAAKFSLKTQPKNKQSTHNLGSDVTNHNLWATLFAALKIMIPPKPTPDPNRMQQYHVFRKRLMKKLKRQATNEKALEVYDGMKLMMGLWQPVKAEDSSLKRMINKFREFKREKRKWQAKRRKAFHKLLEVLEGKKKTLQKKKWDLKVMESDFQHQIYGLQAKIKSMEREKLSLTDDDYHHRTVHNFLVDQMLSMQVQIDSDENDSKKIREATAALMQSLNKLPPGSLETSDVPERMAALIGMTKDIATLKLTENTAILSQLKKGIADVQADETADSFDAEARANALATGIPYARELGESKTTASTQTDPAGFIPYRVLHVGEKLINESVNAEIHISLLNEDICIKVQLDDLELPLFYYCSYDSVIFPDEEEPLPSPEDIQHMSMTGELKRYVEQQWKTVGQSLTKLIDLEYSGGANAPKLFLSGQVKRVAKHYTLKRDSPSNIGRMLMNDAIQLKRPPTKSGIGVLGTITVPLTGEPLVGKKVALSVNASMTGTMQPPESALPYSSEDEDLEEEMDAKAYAIKDALRTIAKYSRKLQPMAPSLQLVNPGTAWKRPNPRSNKLLYPQTLSNGTQILGMVPHGHLVSSFMRDEKDILSISTGHIIGNSCCFLTQKVGTLDHDGLISLMTLAGADATILKSLQGTTTPVAAALAMTEQSSVTTQPPSNSKKPMMPGEVPRVGSKSKKVSPTGVMIPQPVKPIASTVKTEVAQAATLVSLKKDKEKGQGNEISCDISVYEADRSQFKFRPMSFHVRLVEPLSNFSRWATLPAGDLYSLLDVYGVQVIMHKYHFSGIEMGKKLGHLGNQVFEKEAYNIPHIDSDVFPFARHEEQIEILLPPPKHGHPKARQQLDNMDNMQENVTTVATRPSSIAVAQNLNRRKPSKQGVQKMVSQKAPSKQKAINLSAGTACLRLLFGSNNPRLTKVDVVTRKEMFRW